MRKREKMFKRTLQIVLGIALTMPLAGCFYWDHDRDHDRDRHYDHSEHHGDHDHPAIDVNFHG
jgi:hypothetical protein